MAFEDIGGTCRTFYRTCLATFCFWLLGREPDGMNAENKETTTCASASEQNQHVYQYQEGLAPIN